MKHIEEITLFGIRHEIEIDFDYVPAELDNGTREGLVINSETIKCLECEKEKLGKALLKYFKEQAEEREINRRLGNKNSYGGNFNAGMVQ